MIEPVIYNPKELSWDKIKKEIVGIEREAFGKKAYDEKRLADEFQNEKSIIVLLKNDQEIIGFTYAQPAAIFPKEKLPNKEKTVWIVNTVIKKEFQGKKLVGTMSNLLEEELKKQGYKYIARHAAVANNYAKNISKVYRDRIIQQKGPFESKWGPQIFFLIKLL